MPARAWGFKSPSDTAGQAGFPGVLPGSDSAGFEAACDERATANPRDRAFEVKSPHCLAPCDGLELSQR